MPVPAFAADRAGLVEMRRCRATKGYVGLYRSLEAGMESDPELPYTTLCETHSTFMCHTTLKNAKAAMSYPDWCDECRPSLK